MALFLSLLVHVGLLLNSAIGPSGPSAPIPSPAVSERLTDQRTLQLVEVPEDLRSDPPEEQTLLASDKSARAATPEPVPAADNSMPQSRGDLPAVSFPSEGSRTELPVVSGLARPQSETERRPRAPAAEKRGETDPLESRDPATEPSHSGAESLAPSLPLPSSLGLGGVSFNTLEWDFAPYALELKRQIAAHWYPPVAFTHGGLFGGVSVARFRIEPDGTLSRLDLVSEAEHHSLDTAALNAIKLSATFDPLPADFPEPHLEVTFSFHYLLGPRSGPAR